MTAPTSPLLRPPRVLVLGVGNAWRGDDAVGLVVAQHLQEDPLDGVTVTPTAGEGTALLALWQDTDAVVLVDAVCAGVCAGARPGTLHRFAVGTEPLPALFSGISTHAFGVAEAIELARALRQLPPVLVVYGVEGETFETGAGLSAAVAAVVPQVVAQVRQEVLVLTARSTLHDLPQAGQATSARCVCCA
jgi:hydrogenase maturation protease